MSIDQTTPVEVRVSAAPGGSPTRAGVAVEVDALQVRGGGKVLVDGVGLTVSPGEVLAIAGASGAGKSTLLEAMAGLRPISGGVVRYMATGDRAASDPVAVGFVPQDDIIHRDLPLRASLRFAARLRLPATRSSDDVDELVRATLATLELADHADVRVGSLSGGQRKRASIATELLSRPDVLFLDEPTSGLDPATAGEVMRTLRHLAERGTTVVFTTHGLADLERADRIAFVARGGRLAFDGTVTEARRYVESRDLAGLYDLTAAVETPGASGPSRSRDGTGPSRLAGSPADRPTASGMVRQWRVLTRRTVALLSANRLTMAIMFGSPALVVAMMVVLFPAGAAADPANHPTTAVQTVFWVAFAGFFFGLTAGLLQMVPEAAIARRERRAGVRPAVYVASKVTALAPVLVVVSVGMLLVLHLMDRMPTTPGSSPIALVGIVLLESLSALALGLLASALVRDAAQATLALPMLCFPQVLFAGAVIGVVDMAPAGWLVSHAMATRWGFEGIARSLDVGSVMPFAGELEAFEPALTGSAAGPAVVLVAITVALLAGTVAAVRRRTR
jgi:ABC-type multidrug transport system ATPase subunit